ncbi:hypothetical protein M501DRAFT_1004272 [Patellaria atrata CBS 101060]|uniref:Ribosomal protein bL31m N-terminal domain-containing protein n=1 Tax=Patellaria atrata CBS 101060 TaxID=1346257 RepID=A0A9P4VP81_9PEZI|nr:hypothetical protein M501DRAFT_1004272 [Patellaria atrata CBS 101060]
MATKTPLRPSLQREYSSILIQSSHQIRRATLLRRPKRPYTFTQLITLSDGSSFLHRTTSPIPVYRSTKDIKNSPLWNPSSKKLLNVEEDEAGRLRAFRARFGRGWDAETPVEAEETSEDRKEESKTEPEDSLMDLITGYGQKPQKIKAASSSKKGTADGAGKAKGGKK